MSLDAIFCFGSFLFNSAKRLVRALDRMFTVLEDAVAGTGITPPTTVVISKTDTVAEIKSIDQEISDLERKRIRDKVLSAYDNERLTELGSAKEKAFRAHQSTRAAELKERISADPHSLAESPLSESNVNLLHFHMGEMVFGKSCPKCGLPIVLQHIRRPIDYDNFGLADFFWSCSGYYYPAHLKCSWTERFRAADLNLLHRSNIPELEIGNGDLNTIFSEQSIQRASTARIENHLGEEDGNILCPMHHLPMVLREKRDHQGFALDMFHLRCPHFECHQTQKLKSPAQLAAFLHRKEGRGIL
jgi:hypothetical protein